MSIFNNIETINRVIKYQCNCKIKTGRATPRIQEFCDFQKVFKISFTFKTNSINLIFPPPPLRGSR